MSIARTTEITASSEKSFEDAVKQGIRRYNDTIDNVEGAWVKEQKVVVSGDEVYMTISADFPVARTTA